jgi:hypothetical protein
VSVTTELRKCIKSSCFSQYSVYLALRNFVVEVLLTQHHKFRINIVSCLLHAGITTRKQAYNIVKNIVITDFLLEWIMCFIVQLS